MYKEEVEEVVVVEVPLCVLVSIYIPIHILGRCRRHGEHRSCLRRSILDHMTKLHQ